MSSYPKRVAEFVPWSKAMVQGATVGNPRYPGTNRPRGRVRRRKKSFRKKRKRHGMD